VTDVRAELRADIAEYEQAIAKSRAILAELDGTTSEDIRPVLIADALAEGAPQIEWLINGLLAVKGIGILTAEGGVGKSTLAAQLCAGLSAGHGFFGFDSGTAIPTLYFQAEGSKEAFAQRIGCALHSLGISPEGLNLYLPPKTWSPSLNGSTSQTISCVGAKLVVMDTVGLFQPFDENSATEFKALILGPLRRLAEETGAGFLLIHHEGKPSEMRKGRHKIRGTGAFVDDTDLTMRLEAPDGDKVPYRRLIFEKIRHGQPQEPIDLAYSFETATFSRQEHDEAGPDEGTLHRFSEQESLVLGIIKTTPRLSGRQIELAANLNKQAYLATMRRLRDQKTITFEPGPKGAMLWISLV
jgi:RecA-family ATPase